MTESSGESMDGRWRIELLGGLRAARGDRVLTHFQTQKAGALLAYLAYYPERTHRRDALIELLWPEVVAEDGRNSLRQTLFLLRQQLEPRSVDGQWLMVNGPAQTGSPSASTVTQQPLTVIVADRTSVRLNREAVTTDVAEFRAAWSAALPPGGSADRKVGATPAPDARRSEERAASLAQAVELYRGELLPGFFDEWVLQERQWLAGRFFEALEQLLAHLERASEFERALEYARHGVSADPLREEAHRDLIRLLAAVGQPAAALRQYQELERLLKEQLDAAPEPATRVLVREIERLAILRSSGVQVFGYSGVQEGTPKHLNTRTPEHLSPEGENRLVTLLFADMSRSLETTRDLHPEDAAALVNRLLQAMVDVILKYEGRIDHFQGDGLLAVFGIPHAHEDDPERAIHAAMEIRAAAHHLELEVTAGINTGEVYAGIIGSERHQETTVMGPAVGLAARLQEQAQPGQILVGEVTQRLARKAFVFTACSLGLKGLARPTTVYMVEQALVRPEKARGIEGLYAELIGRDEELAKLKAALTQVLGGQGQVVTLIGEAGVGKSRLVAELRQGVGCRVWGVGSEPSDPTPYTRHPTPLWLEGRCLELTMTAAYSLFVDLFRDYFAITRSAGTRPAEEEDRASSERLIACLRVFVEHGELSEERAEEIGPLLGNLLSLRFGNDWDQRLKNASPEQIRYQTLLAARDFFVALARRQPLVLVLEDLHWADSLSLDLISLLLEALPHAALLLLCVYRPERSHKCWHLGTIAARKCPSCYTELPLRELTPEQSGRLVESLLTIDSLPGSIKELILEKSRGNPFFVEEVVRSLMASGMVYREGEVWRAREGIETITLPESIQSVIASRVDRLRPELQQVLQSAAVIGRLFRPRLLEQVRGQGPGAGGQESIPDRTPNTEHRTPALAPDPWPLAPLLWELEEHDLIYQERVVPEEEYSFKHVLTQETIYQGILRRQRPLLHQQVGEAIEALYPGGVDEHVEQLAYHYERSKADEKAVEYLLKAGERARRAYLNEEAIDYLQRALDRLDSSQSKIQNPKSKMEWRLEALRGLGEINHGIGKAPGAENYFRQAIAVGQEMGLAPRELARLYFWLWDALTEQGKRDQVLSLGQEGLALVEGDPESVEAALMNHAAGCGYLQTGKAEGWEFIRRSGRFLQCLPYSEELRPVYFWIVAMYSNDDDTVEEATRWLQIFESKAQQHHDLRAQGDVLDLRGGRLGSGRGDLRGAVPLYAKALEFYRKIGGFKHEIACLALLGEFCLSLGCLQEAEEHAQRGRVVEEALGRGWMMARMLAVIGTVALCQGRWKQAEDVFHEAAQLFRAGPIWWSSDTASYALGRVYLAMGRRHDARRQFEEALALARTEDSLLPEVLSGLEETYEHPEEFRAFCQHLREEQREARHSFLVQWYLEPAGLHAFPQPRLQDEFTAPLASEWVWHDPFGDCGLTVRDGLEIRAANGRDLWRLNRSAPRLLRPISGEFAVQVVCRSVSEDAPAIGGIVLWRNKEHYLRFERGTRGPHEVSFHGCLPNPAEPYPDDVVMGRGRLPAERLFLRLERLGPQVRALCSADGQHWFTVGHVEFPVAEPVEIGLHAIGNISRLIYPGAYPEGTAIRFESFELWTNND